MVAADCPLPIDSPPARDTLISNGWERPVDGVRNPVGSTSFLSDLRSKSAGTGSPESGGKPRTGDPHQTVSPVRLLEAATHPE